MRVRLAGIRPRYGTDLPHGLVLVGERLFRLALRGLMPNPAYQKGVRFEREVVTAFRKIGCQATRSAGSHGVWDVTVHTHCDAVRNPTSQFFS